MVKIFKSVGKNCSAECHDVAAVQMALKKAKFPQGGRCWYNGPVDGKKTLALEQAIAIFQEMNDLPVTARIEPTGPTRTALTKALNANWVGLQGIPGTTCLYVPGPYPGFDPIKQTEKSAPFPTPETIGLCKVMTKAQNGFGLTLTRKQDSISQDGRFMTLLAVEYDQFIDNASANLLPVGTIPTDAIKAIQKVVQSEPTWNEGSPGTLGFSSKRQVEALKGAKEPSAHFLQQTGLTKSSTPIINQLLAGAEKARVKSNSEANLLNTLNLLIDSLTGADDDRARRLKEHAKKPAKDNPLDNKFMIYLVAREYLTKEEPSIIKFAKDFFNKDKKVKPDYSLPGHVFIGGINDGGEQIAHGFYPIEGTPHTDKLIYDPEKQSSEVKDDTTAFINALNGDSDFAYYAFKVTPSQHSRILATIKYYASGNDYGLKKNNCVHAAFAALRAGGIEPNDYGIIFSVYPTHIYQQLNSLGNRNK